MNRPPTLQSPLHRHKGSALILVLVVIAMLSLGAYTFSELMITEYRAADAYGRQLQTLSWAQSGVDYVTALLTPDGGGWSEDLYNNPAIFHIPISSDGGFSILAPIEDVTVTAQSRDQGASVIRLGLMDESAKINVNALAALDPADGVALTMLMALPGMTEEIADSILDWIDTDETPRTYGKEAGSYETVTPRNGPLASLEELLLVEGVTPAMLYGEDTNRNGVLDVNENDSGESMPWDNADDLLDVGWSEYLTVVSKESNLQHSTELYGTARLNLNQQLLTDLYDDLEEAFDSEVALFVTAYRLNGPIGANGAGGAASGSSSGGTSSGASGGTSGSSSSGSSSGSSGGGAGSSSGGSSSGRSSGGTSASSGSSSGTSISSGAGSAGSSTRSSGSAGGSSSGGTGSGTGSGSSTGGGGSSASGAGSGGSSGGSSGGGSSSGSGSSGSQSSTLTGLWRPSLTSTSTSTASTGSSSTDSALASAASALAGALGGATGSVTRGGMDVSSGGSTQITSVYQLIGVQVSATINGQATTLDSPWPADPGSLQKTLPLLLDQVTITDEPAITGRININEARLSVLTAIPDMPEDLPEKIIATRSQRLTSGSGTADRFSTAGWLLIEGLVDLPTMIKLDSSATGHGEVYRIQVVGHGDRGGPISRIEAVVDASTLAPKILQQRNLSRLGSGFRQTDLPEFGTTTNNLVTGR